ncbi:MAG: hypothetical protein V9G21_00900 [Methylotenera sp.]
MVRGLESNTASITETQSFVPPTQWNLPLGPPLTRHARNGQTSIAYQVIGSAPLDLLVVPDFVSHLELAWEHPRLAAFLRRLSSFARLIADRPPRHRAQRPQPGRPLARRAARLTSTRCWTPSRSIAPRCSGLGAGAGLGAAYAAMRPDRTPGPDASTAPACGPRTTRELAAQLATRSTTQLGRAAVPRDPRAHRRRRPRAARLVVALPPGQRQPGRGRGECTR